jgi:DNA-binding NtrC family response regulator
MSPAGFSGLQRRYRLRGEVAGVERSYVLDFSPSRIGSVRGDNEIVLQVRGVSRHHARVFVQKGELTLEDLGSKNGTLANGVRIQRTQIEPGDKICVGPVTLWLEEIDPDDAVTAFPLPSAPDPILPPQKTTDIIDVDNRATGGAWLSLVESLLSRLSIQPQADLAGALTLLVKELPARGACVFEGALGSEPVVVAASGDIDTFSRDRSVLDAVGKALGPAPEGVIRSVSLAGDHPLVCAVLEGPGRHRLGLAAFGETGGGLPVETLLRIILGLIARFRPQPVHVLKGSSRRTAGRDLIFPEAYIRGESPAMVSLYGQMQPLLEGDLPVLILGETGVGKEILARSLHASSARREKPFVAINCAAIPADLLEAEMFGIGKGIATGVVERAGKFQLAQHGTLFLDEIGDMSPGLQAKLLRALQEKEIQPVGGAPVAVDIRVVAATNSDLLQRIEEGRFRRDLYYRVAGYALRVPALRERREDIPALVEGFMRAFALEAEKSVRGITVKALRMLVEYSWPGNIRELEHEVRRLVYLCPEGQAIDSSMLSSHLLGPSLRGELPDPVANGGSLELDAHVRKLEERLIRQATIRARGNKTPAAKLLGSSGNGLTIKEELPDPVTDGGSLELDAHVRKLEERLIRQALIRARGNRTQAAKLLGISRNGLTIKMKRLGIKD